VLGETSRDDRLSCELINSTSEIGCDEIFHDAILYRVKTDDRDLSTNIQFFDCFFDRDLDMLELSIHGYSEGLEYSLWRILVIARSSDDLKEIICRIYRFDFTGLDDGSSDMD
jgi:hypothetical protein